MIDNKLRLSEVVQRTSEDPDPYLLVMAANLICLPHTLDLVYLVIRGAEGAPI
jgi:hypothetical protein